MGNARLNNVKLKKKKTLKCEKSDAWAWCDSTVDHVTALLIMWQHCQLMIEKCW
jgi:hypothetical protein